MNLDLVGKDVEPSDTLRTRIEQKLSKFEARLGQKLKARVALSQRAGDYVCTVHFMGAKHEFNAMAEGNDLFRCADEALAKVERQLRKAQHKGEATRKPGYSLRGRPVSVAPADAQG